MTENEPDIDHLDVRGGGQAFHLADEDGGHHQHGRQVHAQCCLKEERLEEGGGKGDGSQEKGRKVRGHHFACNLSFHYKNHSYALFVTIKCFVVKFPIGQSEIGHVNFLTHNQKTRQESDSFTV